MSKWDTVKCVQYPSHVAKLCNETWIGKSVVKHCQNCFEYFMRFLFYFFTLPLFFLATEREVCRGAVHFCYFMKGDNTCSKTTSLQKSTYYSGGECLIWRNVPRRNAKPSTRTTISSLLPSPLSFTQKRPWLNLHQNFQPYTCVNSTAKVSHGIIKKKKMFSTILSALKVIDLTYEGLKI
jgi:hypothetical protein